MRLHPACMVLLAAWAVPAFAGEEDEVVATVNGKPITRAELVEELMIRHGEAVLDDMIHTRVVEQEMARSEIIITEEMIDLDIKRQRRILASGPREKRSLEQMVAAKFKMSMEGYRVVVRRWLLIREMILRQERPTEEDMMWWFYQNREQLYDTPAEYTVRHIFISRKAPGGGRDRTPAELKQIIAKIRQAIIKGEDFGRLAEKYSDDGVTRKRKGKLGTVNERFARANLEPDFVEAMMLLKPGLAGGPVETPKGFHFLQVTGRRDRIEARYEKCRRVARIDYLEQRAELRKEIFMRELMERAKVTKSFVAPKRKRAEVAPGAAPSSRDIR